MIKSMTGYGRAQEGFEAYDITVEMRSVNHRFLECTCRLPRSLSYLEEKIKSVVGQSALRGKVDVYVTVQSTGEAQVEVALNESLARAYVDALRRAGEALNVHDDLGLTALSRIPDVFSVQKLQEDETQMWALVGGVLARALEGFLTMRSTEGERLKADMLSQLLDIEAHVAEIEARGPTIVEEYRQRLTQKLQELLGSERFDEQRILTEAALFAERMAVNEELVRLKSHIGQFRAIVGKPEGAVGRKLDFLTQELGREINTIGSKASDLDTTRRVVEMKSALEKIREQVQNVE